MTALSRPIRRFTAPTPTPTPTGPPCATCVQPVTGSYVSRTDTDPTRTTYWHIGDCAASKET